MKMDHHHRPSMHRHIKGKCKFKEGIMSQSLFAVIDQMSKGIKKAD
jgi:hypothetical protein